MLLHGYFILPFLYLAIHPSEFIHLNFDMFWCKFQIPVFFTMHVINYSLLFAYSFCFDIKFMYSAQLNAQMLRILILNLDEHIHQII